MSQAAYFAMKPQFTAIKKEDVKMPNMPLPNFLQEAECTLVAGTRDLAALLEAGLKEEWLTSMAAKIGALNYAESVWFTERNRRDKAQKRWNEKAPDAYAQRDHLLRTMRYAYRDLPDLKGKVVAIAGGTGHAGMISDLHKLVALAREFAAPLWDIKLKPEVLDQAQATADEMGALLAQLVGEKALGNEAKRERDQAYTLLKQAVDEVRACARYAFWNDERRRGEYSSQYLRNQRRQAAKRNQTPGDSPSAQA